jgi:PAS domain S-box-containing protein
MNPASILIVEDEQIVAEDLGESLRQMGYTVCSIESTGESAVTAAAMYNPDLILMDIFLAGPMNGIDAAVNITRRQEVPIIFLTAFADSQIVERAKIIQPYGYILKPFDERELKTSIEIALYKFRLDRQLKESEERYRGFVQNFLGIAFRMTTDRLPVFLHGAVEKITGYTEKEFLNGTPSWEGIFHPEDLERVISRYRQASGGEAHAFSIEYRISRIDGTVRWLQETGRFMPGTDATTGYFQGTRYDITERKEGEQFLVRMNEILEERVKERTKSLNDQIQFLQQLIDTIPSPIFYKDTEGRYIGCNAGFEAYAGRTNQEIIGKTDEALFPPDLVEITNQKDRTLVRNRGIQVYQAKYLHADRTFRDVIFKRATFSYNDGSTAGLIGVMLDITDQIRAEEDLAESERRFREVVQDQTELIIRFRPDWTVIFANDAFLNYFSHSRSDITGFIFHPPVHPEDEHGFRNFIDHLTLKEPFDSTEVRILHMDGSVRWQHWNVRAFFDENDQVTQYQAVVTDITERRENERVLHESYIRIESNLRQFAILNDQIRNPLSVISILAGLDDTPTNQKILKQVSEIDRIISQLDQGFLDSEKIRSFLKKHHGMKEDNSLHD